MLLSYLDAHPRAEVTKLIGISLMEGKWELGEDRHAELLSRLRRHLAQGDRSLMKERFSFCNPLHATAKSLMSYLEWAPQRILHAIETIPTDQVFILGSRDQRLGAEWLDDLRRSARSVHVIQGANHFMDGEHEFELLDRVLVELQ